MTTITVNTPAATAAPRGATWAGNLAAGLLSWLQRKNQERRERNALAARLADAAAVRRYAWQMETVDRRFAADLLAAADRHERG